MTDIILSTQNGEPVVSSRQIAESFEKNHRDVLRAIDSLKEDVRNFAQMFFETETPDSYGRPQRTYLMNRDGFTLLAMGFTGKAALEWKIKYIAAFNAMEKKLKESSPDYSELSPTLRYLIEMEQRQHQQEQALAQTNLRIDEMRGLIALNPNNWRQETKHIIAKIARKMGGSEHSGDVYEEAYGLLEERGHFRLSIRLENLRDTLRKNGATKTEIARTRKMDVIAADPRAIEIWVKVISELAIKYGVAAEE